MKLWEGDLKVEYVWHEEGARKSVALHGRYRIVRAAFDVQVWRGPRHEQDAAGTWQQRNDPIVEERAGALQIEVKGTDALGEPVWLPLPPRHPAREAVLRGALVELAGHSAELQGLLDSTLAKVRREEAAKPTR